jgi:hypothetical protein
MSFQKIVLHADYIKTLYRWFLKMELKISKDNFCSYILNGTTISPTKVQNSLLEIMNCSKMTREELDE